MDVAYQSLTLAVPLEVDGLPVDTAGAPILLANAVAGYLPSSTSGAGVVAAPLSLQALARGLVVVEPGLRGRGLVDGRRRPYGAAPAALVDLKAAVRWLRFNAGRVPGDPERIVATGSGAGGGLAALLAASGESSRFLTRLRDLGAADASDSVFACGAWGPVTDLDHADIAYEWCWGALPLPEGATGDPALSAAIADAFPAYQQDLDLPAPDGSPLTADRLRAWLLDDHLIPAATRALKDMEEDARALYLAQHPAILWDEGSAVFDWDGYLAHVAARIGRRVRPLPAFDRPDLTGEGNSLFAAATEPARSYTDAGLRRVTGDPAIRIEADLRQVVRMMNPMSFLIAGNRGRARRWWFRAGSLDTDCAPVAVLNMAAASLRRGDQVDLRFDWDSGPGALPGVADFLDWVDRITGRAGAGAVKG